MLQFTIIIYYEEHTSDGLIVIRSEECLLRCLNSSSFSMNRLIHINNVSVERVKNIPDTMITVIDIGQ